MNLTRPHRKPSSPQFGSGPCRKIPGWSPALLDNALIGRSHRSPEGIERLHDILSLTRSVLDIPNTHHIAIIPGSATGAIECALWNLLGKNPATLFSHDIFSNRWSEDVINQLKIKTIDHRQAPHGLLPSIAPITLHHDIVLNWNGSTSGVTFPHLEFIAPDHQGLVIVDVTSAAFTTHLPWEKMDAVAFSWQKGLGSEAAHGLLVLGPKAIDRLNSYSPSWPIPYMFKLRSKGQFSSALFHGKTLNTPSLLCTEDFHQALLWAQRIGGLKTLCDRSAANLDQVKNWIQARPWVRFMAQDPATISSSTLVLEIINPLIAVLPLIQQWEFLHRLCKRLSDENVAFDIINHEAAPPSLRIWGGPTIPQEDISILLDWIDWAYHTELSALITAQGKRP